MRRYPPVGALGRDPGSCAHPRGRGDACGPSVLRAEPAGRREPAVALRVDGSLLVGENFAGRDGADGAVEPPGVVVRDEAGDDAAGLVETRWPRDAEGVTLQCLVPAFDFAVGLRKIAGSVHVAHARNLDKLLAVAGDELGPVVADDTRSE